MGQLLIHSISFLTRGLDGTYESLTFIELITESTKLISAGATDYRTSILPTAFSTMLPPK
jgi:hypothetical protein